MIVLPVELWVQIAHELTEQSPSKGLTSLALVPSKLRVIAQEHIFKYISISSTTHAVKLFLILRDQPKFGKYVRSFSTPRFIMTTSRAYFALLIQTLHIISPTVVHLDLPLRTFFSIPLAEMTFPSLISLRTCDGMVLEIHQFVNRLDKLVQLDIERVDALSEERYTLVMDAIRSLPGWHDSHRGKHRLPVTIRRVSATSFAFECLFDWFGDQTQPVPPMQSVTLDLVH